MFERDYANMVELAYCPPGGPTSGVERSAEFDDFASEEVQAALTLTRRAADSELHLGWLLLERFPQVWRALDAGEIDLRKARTIVRCVGHLELSTARDVIDRMIDKAPELTTGQLAARIRRLCVEADPGQAKKEYQEALEERRVVAEPNPDGTAGLYGINLPPERIAAIRDRINTMARSLRSVGEERTMDQLRADVFLDVLEGNQHLRPTRRGVVDIHLDLATLMQLDDNPGDMPGWGPVIADIARQIAADYGTEWRTTVTDPDTRQVLWNGTTRRRPDTKLTKWIQARYHTCVFPGCRMPARACDIDHHHPHAEGGCTAQHNLGPLCRRHHVARHERNWRIRRDHQGRYHLTSPHQHTYITTGRPP